MRASLVSATSVLALLLAEDGVALAGPRVGVPQPFQLAVHDAADADMPRFQRYPDGSRAGLADGATPLAASFAFAATNARSAASDVVAMSGRSYGSTGSDLLTLIGVGTAPAASAPTTVSSTGNPASTIGAASPAGSSRSIFSGANSFFSLNDQGADGITTTGATRTSTYTYAPAAPDAAVAFPVVNSAGSRSSAGTFTTTPANGVAPVAALSSNTRGAFTFAPLNATQSGAGSTLSNGTDSINGSSAQTSAPSATGVASAPEVTSARSAAPIRAGASAAASTTTSNTGNLNGSVASASSGWDVMASGTNANVISQDKRSVSTLGYTYAPLSRSTVNSTLTRDAGNTVQTVSAAFMNPAVEAAHAGSTAGSSAGETVSGTPGLTPGGSIGAASPAIQFGTVGYNKLPTVYLALQNPSPDTAASLANRPIERFAIASANGTSTSVPGAYGGSVTGQQGQGQILLPIRLSSTSGPVVLNSSLTIFTDESAFLGNAFINSMTAYDTPEPASLAVLGAGLAGLAGIRRRRR